MKTFLEKAFSSSATTIVLLAVYAFALAAATFIEKYWGTGIARMLVYYSPLFFLLQLLLVVNFVAIVIKRQLLKKRKWGFMLVHFSFIIILLGATISHIFSREGILHLREGEQSNQITIQTAGGNETYEKLPFSLELEKFTLVRYPGSSSPSSYESDVLVHVDRQTYKGRIFMNNVLDVKGYRFFQASFDRDEKGTILSVNKDMAGRRVTYTGYLMLALGFVCFFVGKNSRLRQISRLLKEMRKEAAGVVSAILLLCLITPQAEAAPQPNPMLDAIRKMVVDPAHAARFGALPVQAYNGRIMPVNTFSSEILRKIHKDEKIENLNPDQFLLSLLSTPEMWMRVPFIALRNKTLAEYYDLSEGQCALVELFDSNGDYKLGERVNQAYSKNPAERSGFDKDLLKLDEQASIVYQLTHYQLLNLFPMRDDPNHKWYAAGDNLSSFASADSAFVSSILFTYLQDLQTGLKTGDWTEAGESLSMIEAYQTKTSTFTIDAKKISTELKYNKLNPFRICKICYLILGGLLLILAFCSLFKERKWMKWAIRLFPIAVLIVFHFHMMGMAMRWIIGGYAPWSNSYETMVYVSWAAVFGGLLFVRRSTITFALATLFGGVILFVSSMNWMDPQINLLVPVLKSPWLMFHVAVIVAAYGFFGISCLIGITNLVMQSVSRNSKILLDRVKELSLINEMSLWIGLALMTIGTFLGAVWANESWGRYWGWDPKETWALITVVVYAIVLHLRLVKKWDNVKLFNWMTVLAFATVLMTYFGVNYFLTGMHSYGG
ncbi:cytochrome c biogenesis protein [Bacteroidia bacterium]|nr:cytochrome c biogenesis protein [Bacteroidia bacterium]